MSDAKFIFIAIWIENKIGHVPVGLNYRKFAMPCAASPCSLTGHKRGKLASLRGIFNMKIERLKEILKPKAFKDLMEFMRGQTYDANGIYEHDFLRWFYKQEIID